MEAKLEKHFNEIYDKIYSSCKERLDDVKRQNRKIIYLAFFIMILLNIAIYFNPNLRSTISIVICCCICVLMILFLVANSNYRRAYKQSVIEGIVKGYNEKFYYDEKYGVMRKEYLFSEFDRTFDDFYSEDRIYGKLENGENFQMSEIVTYNITKTKDSEGNTRETRTETFRGIYGIVRLKKNIASEIHIRSNSMFRKYSKNRLEMESSEFEKFYDCLSVDKVSTMRVFTAELIEKYNELAKIYNKAIEVKISDDHIYFRYKTNKLFEPPMFFSGLDKEFLKGYFRVIFYPIEIMNATIKNINSVYE